MKEKNMRFGEYVRKKRLACPARLSMQEAADCLGVSLSYLSSVESCNKRPLDGDKLEQLVQCYELSEEEAALMFDIAAREDNGVPVDIVDIFLHEEIGELARYALRLSKAGVIKEEDWQAFIRRMEEKDE